MKLIPLTKGMDAMIDDEDFERVTSRSWHVSRVAGHLWYAKSAIYRNGVRIYEYLHHFLMPGIKPIDHIDGNGLNCQKHNLRHCTQAENLRNQNKIKLHSTPYKGVHFFKRDSNYRAAISLSGRTIHLGYFPTAIEAAKAYDLAAPTYHGEFCKTNQSLGLL